MKVQILISVFLGALGQVLVKYGAVNLDLNFSPGHLLWIKVLSKVELSYAYPMVSLGYVLVMIFSYFLFKENITPLRIAGVLFIILGVVLVARS